MRQKISSLFKQMTFLILGTVMLITFLPVGQTIAADCNPAAPAGGIAGGIVPCNRLCDDKINTPLIDESKPCDLCALFYMLKKVINFITTMSIAVGVFVLIMSGLLYALSSGNPGKIEFAKSAATSVVIGLAIISVSWLGVAFALQGMGYADIGTWDQVNCNLPIPLPT